MSIRPGLRIIGSLSLTIGVLLAQPKAVLVAFGLQFCAFVFSMLATGLVFARFQESGLVELSLSLNYSAVLCILASLSLETGMVRRFMTASGTEGNDIKPELLLLYVLGLSCAAVYLVFFLPALSFVEIALASALVLISFPYAVVRAQWIAHGRAAWTAAGPLIIAASALFSAVASQSPAAIFLSMVAAQTCLILMWMMFASLRSNFAGLRISAFSSIVQSLQPARHIRPAVRQLRFSAHSLASGLQANEFFILARLFLVAYVGTESAGQMEMYQRPLVLLFGAASLCVSLFAYPALIAQESMLKDGAEGYRLIRKSWIHIVTIGCLYLFASGIAFPFLFWLLYGFDQDIGPGLACFWIGIFGLRFIGAYFSSWSLAMNRVSNAIAAECILYVPPILLMALPDLLLSSIGMKPFELYFGVIGFSSILYVLFLMIVTLRHRNPFIPAEAYL